MANPKHKKANHQTSKTQSNNTTRYNLHNTESQTEKKQKPTKKKRHFTQQQNITMTKQNIYKPTTETHSNDKSKAEKSQTEQR